jgi:hypothetical protein
VLQGIIKRFGRPSVDLFASDMWHVAERFVTPRFMPGCSAVDALRSDWRRLVRPDEVAWIFPATRALTSMVHALKRFKTSAILEVPESKTTNSWNELINLGIEARMEGPLTIDRSTDACIPSRRVPAGTANPALHNLRAYKISWE